MAGLRCIRRRRGGERVAVNLAGDVLITHFGVDLTGEGVAAGGDGDIHGARAVGVLMVTFQLPAADIRSPNISAVCDSVLPPSFVHGPWCLVRP